VNYTYSLYAESNNEWFSEILNDNSPGVIEPSGSVQFTVILTIPDGTPAGTVDNMIVWVKDDSGGRFKSTLINTTVLPLSSFDLIFDGGEVTVRSGFTHRFLVMVANTGNVNTTVSLVVTGEQASWANFSNTLVTITAGETKEEYLIITIPEGVEGKYTFYLEGRSGTTNKTKWFHVNVVRRDVGSDDDDTDDSTISGTLLIAIIIFIIIIVVVAIIGILLLLKGRKKYKYEEEWPELEENLDSWDDEGLGEGEEDDWEIGVNESFDHDRPKEEDEVIEWEEG
jgi:hypothetical protein